MDATMRSYMHQVFETMMELEPQSPSAIPGTKKEFENTMDAVKQYSNFFSTVTSLAFVKPLNWTASFNGMNQRHPRPR